jgi:hypothetical protein
MHEVLPEVIPIFTEMVMALPKVSKMQTHKHGYTEDEMLNMFTEGGFAKFTFEEVFVREKEGSAIALFLARGVNPG